jgi:hypothetical protein
MVCVFGPSVDKHFERAQGPNETANETRESSDQRPRQDASAQPPQQSMSVQPTQHVGSQLIQQNPHQAIHMVRWHSVLLEFNLSLLTG